MHDVKDASPVRTVLGQGELGIGEWYQHCGTTWVLDGYEKGDWIGVVGLFLYGLEV